MAAQPAGGLNVLPVLMYHGLHRDPEEPGFDSVYSVPPDAFALQLDWIVKQGYRAVTLEHALASGVTVTGSGPPVVITFDDGDVSNAEVALAALQARGQSAEFFITSDFIGQPGRVSSADVRRLAESGMGIGSHGRTHALLEDLSESAMRAELRDSRHHLQDIIGREVVSFALPGGRGGERERQAALELGYRHLLGSVPGPNHRPRPGQWLQRLAVTRALSTDGFASLVQWRGPQPLLAQARFLGLALPKRLLGNQGYERLRARFL